MIRVMSVEPTERAGVWSAHRADVEARIVDAYMDLLESASPGGAAMPAVAERAGVSVRTLYRYFPRRDDLERAAAGWLERGTREAMANAPVDMSTARHYLRLLWPDLAKTLPAVLVQHTTPAGRNLRAARLAQNRVVVDRALDARVTGDRRAEVVDLLVAVSSSSMFLELVDRMGHDPERAADLVADLIELIVERETSRRSPAPQPVAGRALARARSLASSEGTK
jgi:AcrR family transcriptional regulator